ncbi:hypothetical protein [Mycobacteroides abscessus]|uniref:hypothetical protein n=1 Tax=Mycobacteroides abscessus TaxID=36809 RepID=UPI00094198BB|nr:hypothetical protein [Mycobacteroides abscessus]
MPDATNKDEMPIRVFLEVPEIYDAFGTSAAWCVQPGGTLIIRDHQYTREPEPIGGRLKYYAFAKGQWLRVDSDRAPTPDLMG